MDDEHVKHFIEDEIEERYRQTGCTGRLVMVADDVKNAINAYRAKRMIDGEENGSCIRTEPSRESTPVLHIHDAADHEAISNGEEIPVYASTADGFSNLQRVTFTQEASRPDEAETTLVVPNYIEKDHENIAIWERKHKEIQAVIDCFKGVNQAKVALDEAQRLYEMQVARRAEAIQDHQKSEAAVKVP